MAADSALTITWTHRLEDIAESAWDALAQPLSTPFLEWNWLANLERSGSVSAHTGWQPCHLTLWRGTHLVAAAPMYLKGHSYGEFVFDHQWADLADRLGLAYYPKLLGMTPFTPTEGYQFLIAPEEDQAMITLTLVQAIDRFCQSQGISSCHFLYVHPTWRETMRPLGFSPWLHHSYIWRNQGFKDFDDYLAQFNANQRRNIKRERQSLAAAGLDLQVVRPESLSQALCDLMYDYYADTCDKFGWWGSKYLNRQFFQLLHHNYRHRLVFFAAYGEGHPLPVGMSFCVTKGDRLYGRYWGSREDFNHLHFNACYYAPIEWGIDHGIQVFDPGAGGRHKQRRGFPASPNHSLHRFYHPRLETLLNRYIAEVNGLEQQEIEAINASLPIKLTANSGARAD
ncbi:MAG: GNAT family N-acetyltransferase [Cyanobacteria bacterium REEB459]|nr:GNAT family N-acetyltransferase [Cyanobacteria bacterium REEB459]